MEAMPPHVYLAELFQRSNRTVPFEKALSTLTGVAQWVGCCPTNLNVTGSIPSQGTCLVFGLGPRLGACKRQLINVSLPPFPSLKINTVFEQALNICVHINDCYT